MNHELRSLHGRLASYTMLYNKSLRLLRRYIGILKRSKRPDTIDKYTKLSNIEHEKSLYYEYKITQTKKEIQELKELKEELEYIDIDQQTGYDIYYSAPGKYILKPPPGVTLIATPEYNSLMIVLDYALETDGGGEPIEIEVEAKIPIIVSNMGADDITRLISAVDEAVKDYFGDKFGKGGALLSDILYLKSPTKRTSKLGVYIEVSDEISTVEKGGKCGVEYMVELKGKFTKRVYQFNLDDYISWW